MIPNTNRSTIVLMNGYEVMFIQILLRMSLACLSVPLLALIIKSLENISMPTLTNWNGDLTIVIIHIYLEIHC